MTIPGIPPLLNNITNLGNKVNLLVTDARRVIGLFSNAGPQWGIYQKGKLAVKPDNIVSLGLKADWRVADYPMENGAFETYNKVTTPREVRVVMSKGGDAKARSTFLQTVNKLANGTTVYDVYMPEGKLPGFTISHVGYDRSATKGAGLISVEVHFVEVREIAVTTFTNTAAASGQSPQDGGTVQPQTPDTAQRAIVGGGGAAGGGF